MSNNRNSIVGKFDKLEFTGKDGDFDINAPSLGVTASVFMDFKATESADTASPLSSLTAGNSVNGHIRINVNGVNRWIRTYDFPSS